MKHVEEIQFYSRSHHVYRFDEVHFGRFTTYFLNGTFFFDVHPPLVKLVFAYTGMYVTAVHWYGMPVFILCKPIWTISTCIYHLDIE